MDKPILYGSATCQPCLEVCDFIRSNALDIDTRWVLARMDPMTCERYHVAVRTSNIVTGLGGVPTLVDGTTVVQGSSHIINYLTNKYKSS
jgi:hypothetical protein